MKGKLIVIAVAVSLFLLQNPVLAHHGQAGYNVKEPVTVSGMVTGFQFVNPHCIVSLDVMDEKGEAQKWQGELTSPNHLLRAGWTASSLKAGDKITLTGFRAKSGANSLWITKTVVNGEELTTAAGN